MPGYALHFFVARPATAASPPPGFLILQSKAPSGAAEHGRAPRPPPLLARPCSSPCRAFAPSLRSRARGPASRTRGLGAPR
eukprot:13957565-Alexandrium_andersonii.AAC.1